MYYLIYVNQLTIQCCLDKSTLSDTINETLSNKHIYLWYLHSFTIFEVHIKTSFYSQCWIKFGGCI